MTLPMENFMRPSMHAVKVTKWWGLHRHRSVSVSVDAACHAADADDVRVENRCRNSIHTGSYVDRIFATSPDATSNIIIIIIIIDHHLYNIINILLLYQPLPLSTQTREIQRILNSLILETSSGSIIYSSAWVSIIIRSRCE